MTHTETPAVRPAATLMVVRDAPQIGIEVYMQVRNKAMVFAAGASVFPGGAVDPSDHDPRLVELADGCDPEWLDTRIGLPAGAGLAHLTAAVRETFEEAGLLFAVDASGRLVEVSESLVAARWRLVAGRLGLFDLLVSHDLRLAAGELHYFGHWTTPRGETRRYDTRFFIAAAPPGQRCDPDRSEAVAGDWVRPQEMLERGTAGDVLLITPTEASLRALAAFGTAERAVRAAAAHPPLVRVEDGWQVPSP